MKRVVIGAASSLLLGVIVFGFVVVYTAIGRSRGEEWSSLNGPGPVWPSVLGFGSVWLMAMSGVLLGVLVSIALVREYLSGLSGRR